MAQSPGRGEPRSVRADAEGRVRGRDEGAARQDRHGVAQPQPARPGDLPHPARHASSDRRRVVHLPDVRLRARHLGLRSRASRTRSARWSSRITGRSTTGCVDNLPVPSKPRQIEFARLNLTYTVMSKRKLLQLVQEGLVSGLGRSADADASSACGGAATRRSRSATSPRGSAWRSARTWWTWRCSRTPCATDLNRRAPRAHGGAAAAAGRHRQLPRGPGRGDRDREQSRGPGHGDAGRCRSRASSTSSRTTSARCRRRSTSGCRPGARCGCAAPTSSSASAW